MNLLDHRLRATSRSLMSLLAPLLGLAACAPPGDGIGVSVAEPSAGGGGAPAALRALTAEPSLAAFDEDGALVLVDPTTGELVDRRELAHLGRATDLVLDAARARFVIVLEEEEADAVIAEVPFDGKGLGAARKLAGAAGRARIALLPGGIVVASDTDGPRVRFMRDDRRPTPGRYLPPIRGWRSAGDAIHGLALGPEDGVVRFTLGVDEAGGVVVSRRDPLGVHTEDAVWLEGDRGDEWAALRDGEGALDLVRLDPAGGAPGPRRRLTTRVEALEGGVVWPSGRAALVTSRPHALVVVSLLAEGEFRLPLPAGPESGAPYGRRDLARVGERLFVATQTAVLAVQAAETPTVTARFDDVFDGSLLRGPLVRVEPGLF